MKKIKRPLHAGLCWSEKIRANKKKKCYWIHSPPWLINDIAFCYDRKPIKKQKLEKKSTLPMVQMKTE